VVLSGSDDTVSWSDWEACAINRCLSRGSGRAIRQALAKSSAMFRERFWAVVWYHQAADTGVDGSCGRDAAELYGSAAAPYKNFANADWRRRGQWSRLLGCGAA
jgi:hypothetical protein